ncbi:unnamed protein product [Urochloa decumbens]|uniref:Protein kinase domain-containing protein n=1 Tax=Urochloa decumbens TaxID=240449 RepID=A0ABC8YU01_9POAL
MSGLHDSAVAPPRGRGCCCGCASALCKIAKRLPHPVAVLVIFILILLSYGHYSSSLKIALESVCYAAIACLCTFTPSSQRERRLSGILLSLLAVVIVFSAASAKRSNATVVTMTVCNLLALFVYCIWKLRSGGAAAEVDEEAPLELPVLKEEAGCSTPVQQTTFYIEELPRKFTYEEICAMTGDFGNMVGRGGSGEVFRGLLDDGMPVAVKRITGNKPVGEADFLREISIVASVHHRSLVRLLGYCLLRRGGSHQCLLVYPFFEHGSLDWWLFNGEERRRLLPWPARRRIAVDVARALAYLHHECRRQILHLDIKPANILLDGGLRAHVSDFGVSMSIAQDLTSVDTRGRGTLGYMAPEMSLSKLSVKSDVYSYGMTLLELVCGRRSKDGGDSSETTDFLARLVREKMARGALMEVVDAAMVRVDEGEVNAVVNVALCCVQHRRELRPSMLTVVDILEGRVVVGLPLED